MKEDWENIWYIGMFGGMIGVTVLLYYKPDSACVCFCIYLSLRVLTQLLLDILSVQNWALKEAKQRMEARGEQTEYKPSS